MQQLLQRAPTETEERALTHAYSPPYETEFRCFLARGEAPGGVNARSMLTESEIRQQEVQDIVSGGLWGVASRDFSESLLAAQADVSVMRRVSRVVETSTGGEMMTPTADDRQEGSMPSESETVTQLDVTAGRLITPVAMFTSNIIVASWALVGDLGPKLDAWLSGLGGTRIGRRLNRALTTGDLPGTPRGCIYGVDTGVTAAGTGAVTDAELYTLEDSLDSVFRFNDSTTYMMHSATLSAIRRILDGQGHPVAWSPDPTGRNRAGLIHGFPVHVNLAMPTQAAGARSIVFGDWSQFIVRDVAGTRVQVLRRRYAANAQNGYVVWSRHGGGWFNAGTSPAVLLIQAS